MSSDIDNVTCPICGNNALLEQGTNTCETHTYCTVCGYDSDKDSDIEDNYDKEYYKDDDDDDDDDVKGDKIKLIKCNVSMGYENLKQFLGRDITQEEFSHFCKNAVLSKLWEEQSKKLLNKTKK